MRRMAIRMLRSKFFYSLAILLLLLSACKKDDSGPSHDGDCIEIDSSPSDPNVGFIINFSEGPIQYKSPYFNPNNSSEFVYHYQNHLTQDYQLVKYNIQTQEKTVLVEGYRISSQPKWSRKDWVSFTNHNPYVSHAFIVKANGDSLRQFSENEANLYPAWDNTGNNLFWQYTPNLAVPYYFLRQDLHQLEIVDTLSKSGDLYGGSVRSNDISINNELVSFTYLDNKGCIAVSDLNNNEFQFEKVLNVIETFNYPDPFGMCWSHDGTHLYISMSGPMTGMYRIELDGDYERLMEFCNSKHYEDLSSSPDGNFLIGERVDSYLDRENSGNMIQNSSIYLIDLRTMEEIKIDLE